MSEALPPRRSVSYNIPEASTSQILSKLVDPVNAPLNKVTIVGAGRVGAAIAYSLITRKMTNEIALIDSNSKKLLGEMMDLQNSSHFVGDFKITSSTDYSITANSKVCIIAAGVRQKDNEQRNNLVQRNVELLKHIIPELIKHSPQTILIIVTSPVEVMSTIALKISNFPKNRVIGASTGIDSIKLQRALASHFNISSHSCHGWIIGEQGTNSVVLWSSVNIGGVRLIDVNPKAGIAGDIEKWSDVHKHVVNSHDEVIKMKGYNCWSTALHICEIVMAILQNIGKIMPVAVFAKGEYNIAKNICFSLPVVINASGVSFIVKFPLTETEKLKLENSAEIIDNMVKSIKM